MTKGAMRKVLSTVLRLAGSSGDGGDLGIACVFERHSSNLEVHRVYWVGKVKNSWGT